ncbi:MAG: putative addiction module antidote protein [Reyranella sp.]|nr:putative addiction module antidote protein [Reyranella sp.]MDP3160588.1 putative addiction module antidote protein [Reyranella sp.]
MAIKTVPFDPAEHLRSTEDQVELLNDAFATGNVAYIANALGTIARAHGMSEVARGAGVTREALYKSLTKSGDPKLTTFVSVLRTLKLDLKALPALVTGRPKKITRARNRGLKAGSTRKAARIRSVA